MSRWLIGLLTFWSGYSLSYEAPIEVTVYGDNAYAPYSYEENNQAKGIYVDILNAVFNEMDGYSVTIVPIPWKRGLKLLKLGRGFALFPPYYYSDKRPYISPYSEPILNEEVVVYCHPDSVQGQSLQSWPNDYLGLTVAINEAFELGGSDFWHHVKQGKIRLREEKGNRLSLLSLYNKKADCYLNDRMSILWEKQNMTDENVLPKSFRLKFGTVVSSEQGYLGFTRESAKKYPYKTDFIEQFNFQLNRLKQNGTIDNLIKNHLPNDN
ncbi:substrate-binding periplasmic protein [Vibrio sinaloensis]|uniref:substrate-binding periplasmic protein n=1 Tax=Photobacterium sp. (strain ATCC 43367) TaxID=379097 RepID=UPI0035E95985